MRLLSVFVLSCTFAHSLATSITEVKADISTIPSVAQVLEKSIELFSECKCAFQAEAILNNTASLVASVNKSVADVKALDPVPISISDVTVILNSISDAEGILTRVVSSLSSNKVSFAAVPVCGMLSRVNRDISNIITSFAALRDALVTANPPRASLISHFLDNIRSDFVSLSFSYQCLLSPPLDLY